MPKKPDEQRHKITLIVAICRPFYEIFKNISDEKRFINKHHPKYSRMIFKLKFLICLLLLGVGQLALAQEQPKKEDPAQMYKNIEKYSKKRKFTTFLHKLIFEPMTKKKVKRKVMKTVRQPYAPYECMVIRKINITTLDPFGYSEKDTIKRQGGLLYRAGNALHNKTHNLAIKNLLLIRRNTYLDTLRLLESERLIRSQRYIRGVAINLKAVSKDSVDVYIRVLDSWSLIPDFATSSSVSTFKLRERNFLGTGHEFSNAYRKNLQGKHDAFSSSYTIPNIMNTYVRGVLSYDITIERNYSKFLSIDRPFYSAYAKWAGGVYFDQQLRNEIRVDSNQVEQVQHFKYNSQDYWGGHAFPILKGNTEENRATNLITSIRYLNKNYIEQPDIKYDSLRVFSDEEIYLVGFGLSSRKYTQDKNVLNFNVTEDIGSGIYAGLTGGYQRKNGIGRQYYGARFAYGRYYEFGYLSSNVEYGSFFREGIPQQSAFNASMVYFTPLFSIGKWQFRQFLKPQLIIGNQRLATLADELTLDGDNGNGIQGFSNSALFGTKKLLVNLQTQGYSPWNLYGFRLNPFLSYTMGMLGNAATGFSSSRLYSQFGVGVIVSNDYLVFSSFQVSFSFYPTIPGAGDSIIKTNSFKTSDIGLQNFEVGKPSTVGYQ